jgi:tetratricopeptide (TPR) repeat protein
VYLPYHHTVAAHIYLEQGRIEESFARYRMSVELARKAKYIPGLSQTLSIQGEVLLALNRYAEALPCVEEAAGLFARMRDRDAESHMWTRIATAREKLDDHSGAVAAWARARALRKAFGTPAGELETLERLGAATRRAGTEPALALTHYYEALTLAQTLEDRAAEGRIRNTIGILEWSRGEFARALQHYECALSVFTELGDTAHAGLMLNSVAVTLRELGRLTEAQSRLEEAIALHRETGKRQLEGHALAALGDIRMQLGESEPAAEYYERSLEIRRDIGDRRGEGWMLFNLARCEGAGAGPATTWHGRHGSPRRAPTPSSPLPATCSGPAPNKQPSPDRRDHAQVHHRADCRSVDAGGNRRGQQEVQRGTGRNAGSGLDPQLHFAHRRQDLLRI